MNKIQIPKDFKGKIFFTSDLHFDHANIIKFCHRPFENVVEMNAELISRWNNVVGVNDIVFILGDFCFGSKARWQNHLSQLNGDKYLVFGNHDNFSEIPLFMFKYYGDIFQLSVFFNNEWKQLILNHYCMLTWPGQWRGFYHCFGHSHTTPCGGYGYDADLLKNRALPSYDVGVDNNDFTPIELNKLIKILDKQNEITS